MDYQGLSQSLAYVIFQSHMPSKREPLTSSFSSSIANACCGLIYTPQIYMNYNRKSAGSVLYVTGMIPVDNSSMHASDSQGISVFMIWQSYQCAVFDMVLLLQYMFYAFKKYRNRDPVHSSSSDDPNDCDTLPYATEKDIKKPTASRMGNRLNVFFFNYKSVWWYAILGGCMPLISSHFHILESLYSGVDVDSDNELIFNKTAQKQGWWAVATLLLWTIYEIVQNHKTKSCEHFSPLFVLFKCLEAVLWVAHILTASTGKKYMLTYAPWLVGYLGIIVLHSVILYQFHIYGKKGDFYTKRYWIG
ncbi:unnamed protein product [Kuraishia capsulata CBS 1993]|uniref:Uncharacterized protein n=1 Tax=Kuraishia capsulata CBS 1993 TaxID=1382522 RepID=W6MLB3_9ASCO|nr:uncharacterized protein KUCA_T00003239001 [Kuraishia capsulata CBS 1993]CDK27261.1 unnamed protein product [Kuraishia capsulata CBS 1993]